MKTATIGNPAVLKKPFTRFFIDFMDIVPLKAGLDHAHIPYFAMEMQVSQTAWVLHIADTHRKPFDALNLAGKFELAPMNHSIRYQTRNREAMQMELRSKRAKVGVTLVLAVLLIVVILVTWFEVR